LLVVCVPSFAFVPCPALVHARADTPPSVEPAPELDSIDLARALLADGRRSYRARDFVRAAEQWELAYALMTGIESLHADAYTLAFDLAQAHVYAWELDRDAERLSRARTHLGEFVAWVGHSEHTMDAPTREDRRHAVELLARIDAVQLATRADPPQPPAVSRATTLRRDRARSEVARPWIIAGSTALVGSVAAILVAALGESIVDRDVEVYADFRDRRRRTRSLQAGAGITAGLLGVAGTSMLTVGLMRRRHTVIATPMLSSTSVGAQLRLAW
jgi:hypothetical protein